MSIEERLTRFEERQEAIIQGMMGLTDIMEMQRDKLTEIAEWLQQPGSSDTAEALEAMLNGIMQLTNLVETIPAQTIAAINRR